MDAIIRNYFFRLAAPQPITSVCKNQLPVPFLCVCNKRLGTKLMPLLFRQVFVTWVSPLTVN